MTAISRLQAAHEVDLRQTAYDETSDAQFSTAPSRFLCLPRSAVKAGIAKPNLPTINKQSSNVRLPTKTHSRYSPNGFTNMVMMITKGRYRAAL
jgi:hypothetical protein